MENIKTALLAIFAIIGLTIVLAWPLQLLWNGCLVPAIDGINTISFWQALGLNFLASILFKNSNVKKDK